MNFFSFSNGQALTNNGVFDVGGGDFTPIPNNTQVKAFCDEAKWAEYDGERYINLRWVVIDGEYKDRRVFQKIKVMNQDPKARDKALMMLAAVDTNCGGGLQRIGQEPTDQDLQMNLCNKPMALLLRVWKTTNPQTGETKEGNFVGAVAPLNRQQSQPQQAAPVQSQGGMPQF